MSDVLKAKQDVNPTIVRKSLEVKSDADDMRSTNEKTMLPEAHPVEEAKRSESQEDDKGPCKVTETVP
jgi:multisubunit Na+/H+ antiporter MnhE subunit